MENTHYENTPIQIYRLFHLKKTPENSFSDKKKKTLFFMFLLKT